MKMSDIEPDLSVKFISSEEGKKYYLICEISNTDRLNFPISIYLTNTRDAYKGELLEINLKQMSEDNLHSYNSEALFSDKENYSFSISQLNETEVKLKWKRIQARKKYQLGEIVLSKSEFNIIDYYWKYSARTLKENDEKIKKLQSTVDETLKLFENATTTIEKLNEEKAKLENDLYAKFVTVLNGKKRKIQELEANIQALEECDLNSSSKRLSKYNKNNMNSKSPSINSGSETEMEFDDAIEEIVVPKKTKRLGRRKRDEVSNPKATSSRSSEIIAKPSCSKTVIHDVSDSDDLMDDL